MGIIGKLKRAGVLRLICALWESKSCKNSPRFDKRSVIEHTVIPRDSGHITFYTNESSLIRNEQVVGSSPITSSSEIKASGDAGGFFCVPFLPIFFKSYSKPAQEREPVNMLKYERRSPRAVHVWAAFSVILLCHFTEQT